MSEGQKDRLTDKTDRRTERRKSLAIKAKVVQNVHWMSKSHSDRQEDIQGGPKKCKTFTKCLLHLLRNFHCSILE